MESLSGATQVGLAVDHQGWTDEPLKLSSNNACSVGLVLTPIGCLAVVGQVLVTGCVRV